MLKTHYNLLILLEILDSNIQNSIIQITEVMNMRVKEKLLILKDHIFRMNLK